MNLTQLVFESFAPIKAKSAENAWRIKENWIMIISRGPSLQFSDLKVYTSVEFCISLNFWIFHSGDRKRFLCCNRKDNFWKISVTENFLNKIFKNISK